MNTIRAKLLCKILLNWMRQKQVWDVKCLTFLFVISNDIAYRFKYIYVLKEDSGDAIILCRKVNWVLLCSIGCFCKKYSERIWNRLQLCIADVTKRNEILSNAKKTSNKRLNRNVITLHKRYLKYSSECLKLSLVDRHTFAKVTYQIFMYWTFVRNIPVAL